MRGLLSASWVAAALSAAVLLGGAPAQAAGFTIGVGPGGVNFSVSSGGYCDDGGCPDAFWDMPVYYCPVYYGGEWFRGPVYYRRGPGGTQYWIRGHWRYDAWGGRRPSWACTDRFGPALGFEYYERHGFRMRDEWRTRWHRDHGGPDFDRRHDRDRDWDRRDDRHGPNFDRGNDDRHDKDRHNDDRRDDRHGADFDRGNGDRHGNAGPGKAPEAAKPGTPDRGAAHAGEGRDQNGGARGERPKDEKPQRNHQQL